MRTPRPNVVLLALAGLLAACLAFGLPAALQPAHAQAPQNQGMEVLGPNQPNKDLVVLFNGTFPDAKKSTWLPLGENLWRVAYTQGEQVMHVYYLYRGNPIELAQGNLMRDAPIPPAVLEKYPKPKGPSIVLVHQADEPVFAMEAPQDDEAGDQLPRLLFFDETGKPLNNPFGLEEPIELY